MTKIVLESNSGFEGLFGFKETKHFQISGLALDVGPNPETFPSTPIPGAVWLFGTVLAGGAGFSRWRKRKQTAKAAA